MIQTDKDIKAMMRKIKNDLLEEKSNWIVPEKNNPMEIIIKSDILDTSKIEEGEGVNSFRPTRFDEYIGQKKSKQRVLSYLNGCKKFNDNFPNTFISAPAGCGKTVFANIIANMLNKKFVTCTAGEIKTEQQLVDKIVECNGNTLFLDECHRISNKIGTFLLPILEEYKINGKRIKPFTMIFATTHKGNLSENLSALVQRFSLQLELETYNFDELITIFEQFISKDYQSEIIQKEILSIIAKNCRLVPRIGISLLKEYLYTNDLDQVLKNNNIITEGLTINDIKILKYIKNVNGASKSTLSKFLRVEPKTYEFEIEPYLMFKELITVSNKRKLTKKGEEFLKGLIYENI